ADPRADVREPERPGEGEEADRVGGWVVTEDAGQRHHPPVALARLERPGPWRPGGGGGRARQVAAEGVGGQPVDPGGVAQPDTHLLPLRPRVAERLQPRRGSGATAGGG